MPEFKLKDPTVPWKQKTSAAVELAPALVEAIHVTEAYSVSLQNTDWETQIQTYSSSASIMYLILWINSFKACWI